MTVHYSGSSANLPVPTYYELLSWYIFYKLECWSFGDKHHATPTDIELWILEVKADPYCCGWELYNNYAKFRGSFSPPPTSGYYDK